VVQGQPWTIPAPGKVRGTPTLGLTHHLTITSSTSTIWFSRSLSYMANDTVFKVNHGLYLRQVR